MALKKALISQIKEERAEEQRQRDLKKKHHIQQDKEIIVVEKSNMIKFTIKTLSAVIKIAATIVLLTLAVIGLLTIIYPAPRSELLIIINQIKEQIIGFF